MLNIQARLLINELERFIQLLEALLPKLETKENSSIKAAFTQIKADLHDTRLRLQRFL